MINKIDRLVGARLRLIRIERGLSQQAVGDGVDLSFQQIQKYESGVNRISASVLVALACFFEVPVDTFFADINTLPGQQDPFSKLEVMDNAMVMRLARAFTNIEDTKLQNQILAMVESMSRVQGDKKTKKSPKNKRKALRKKAA